MAYRSRQRALVVVQGDLGPKPAGPQIRSLEIARGLSERYEVTLAASVDCPGQNTSYRVVPRSRRDLVREMRRHDVLVAPLLPPFLMTALADRPCVRVADMYDPVELEIGTLARDARSARTVAMHRALRRFQLRWSDVIICASDQQRRRAIEDLGAFAGERGRRRLVTVPMGVPELATTGTDHPLRRHFKLGMDDAVVLWWGNVWRWLDAITAIDAIEILVRRIPNIRLIITAGRPATHTNVLNTTEEARSHARARGLLGRNVLFFDEWVPYEQRGRYLSDADLGITLHNATPEARLAARTRYTDYMSAALPSVLAEGDDVAADMARSGAAWLVRPRNAGETASAIERALGDPPVLAAAQEACEAMAARYRWPKVVEPLLLELLATDPRRPTTREAVRIASDSASFYARRVRDSCLGTA